MANTENENAKAAETKKAAEAKKAEEKAKAAEAKPERVAVYIPRGASNEDPNYFVKVNGVGYVLPRGQESMVPPKIAAEIERSRKAQERLDRNRDKLLNNAQKN